VAGRQDLRAWVLEALNNLGGSGSVVEVSREVWKSHEPDLRSSGNLFYTWQYDIRWAAQVLRDEGKLKGVEGKRGEPWTLAER
jgi:hypothetical protein